MWYEAWGIIGSQSHGQGTSGRNTGPDINETKLTSVLQLSGGYGRTKAVMPNETRETDYSDMKSLISDYSGSKVSIWYGLGHAEHWDREIEPLQDIDTYLYTFISVCFSPQAEALREYIPHQKNLTKWLNNSLVAEARGQFGNPKEGECPLLDAVTTQWLVKTQQAEKT
jgi:hypothetical protein